MKPAATHRACVKQCSSTVGLREGAPLGLPLGNADGLALGDDDGLSLGAHDGDTLGNDDGLDVGSRDGDALGPVLVGADVGASVLPQQPRYDPVNRFGQPVEASQSTSQE